MSTFTCDVIECVVKEHPNADALDIIEVGLFNSVMKKGVFKNGDLAIYIPEQAICPEEVMKACFCWDDEKNRGKLAGAGYNRVKACKLRGILSQGLVMPIPSGLNVELGQDVQTEIAVEKYQPKIPSSFFGANQPKIAGAFHGYTPSFDVENLKKYKNAFEVGEEVRVTEKLHGTCCVIGAFTKEAIRSFGINQDNLYRDRVYVGTKSLTKRGIVYNPNDDSYIYSKIPKELGVLDALVCEIEELEKTSASIASLVFIGEIYGPGVQKGFDYGEEYKRFRLFEIYFSYTANPSHFHTTDLSYINRICAKHSIPQVPVLYTGPYYNSLIELNAGMSTLIPSQIREGIVIRSENGDKLFKYVSEAYLLRKGEATEYE